MVILWGRFKRSYAEISVIGCPQGNSGTHVQRCVRMSIGRKEQSTGYEPYSRLWYILSRSFINSSKSLLEFFMVAKSFPQKYIPIKNFQEFFLKIVMVENSFPRNQDWTKNFHQTFCDRNCFGCKIISSKTGLHQTFLVTYYWKEIGLYMKAYWKIIFLALKATMGKSLLLSNLKEIVRLIHKRDGKMGIGRKEQSKGP